MADKKKLGFGGQWVDLFKTGRHAGFDGDGKKVTVEVKPEFLNAVASNYDPALHEAPACIGHPETDAPAYGWVAGMRVEGDMLQAQFADTDAGFEEIVNAGRYKKRSPKFYLDAQGCGKFPYLRHVAWLGAEPPAVKGMRDVQRHAQFSEDEGDTVAFEIEFSEGEGMSEIKIDETQVDGAVKKFLKEKFPGLFAEDKPVTAAFSEADRTKLVADATAAASAAFSEELKKRDTKIEELEALASTQVGSSKRAAILQFCESNPTKVLPALKAAGIVQFMESLDDTPATKKISVISFAEKDGAEVKTDLSQLAWFQKHIESLPGFLQFGESFGSLKVAGDGSQIVDPKQVDTLRGEMGVKKPEAAAAK